VLRRFFSLFASRRPVTPAEPECLRFYAPRMPFDYKFCYQSQGHDGDCVFEPRRRLEPRRWFWQLPA
jgi:hypothetical protein